MCKEIEELIRSIINLTVCAGGDGWSVIVCNHLKCKAIVEKIVELDKRFDTIKFNDGWYSIGHPHNDIRNQEVIFVMDLETFQMDVDKVIKHADVCLTII